MLEMCMLEEIDLMNQYSMLAQARTVSLPVCVLMGMFYMVIRLSMLCAALSVGLTGFYT